MKKNRYVLPLLLLLTGVGFAQNNPLQLSLKAVNPTPRIVVNAELEGLTRWYLQTDSLYLPAVISVKADGRVLWLRNKGGAPHKKDVVHWRVTENGITIRIHPQLALAKHNFSVELLADKRQFMRLKKVSLVLTEDKGHKNIYAQQSLNLVNKETP